MNRGVAGSFSAVGLLGLIAAIFRRWRRACCDPAVGGWTEDPAWSADGLLGNVGAFNDFVAETRPCWRHDAISAALAALGIDPSGDAPMDTVVVSRAPSAGSGEVDVTLVYEVEGDDSVAGIRYRFTFVDEAFVGGTAGVYRLVEGRREFRCQPGRGQTDWGPELCL